MTVNINAKTTDVHHPSVWCSTYETVAQYVNSMPCIFISAFRGDPCRDDYYERLLKEVDKSDLTYIKCRAVFMKRFAW